MGGFFLLLALSFLIWYGYTWYKEKIVPMQEAREELENIDDEIRKWDT